LSNERPAIGPLRGIAFTSIIGGARSGTSPVGGARSGTSPVVVGRSEGSERSEGSDFEVVNPRCCEHRVEVVTRRRRRSDDGLRSEPVEHRGDRLGQFFLSLQAVGKAGTDLVDGEVECVEPIAHHDVERRVVGRRLEVSRGVARERRETVGAFAFDQFGQALFGALGCGLRLRAGELHLLLRDLCVGGERGELAVDLCLDLFDSPLQFVHLDDGLGGALVAEEAVDRAGVEGVVEVSWSTEHDGRSCVSDRVVRSRLRAHVSPSAQRSAFLSGP
jgi:hypothetical protein